MLNTQPGEYVITITDCNSITEALITLRRGALNIKYGPNGTGKSTIARALVLNAQGADSLRELLPFKYRQGGNGKAPAVSGAAQIKNVLIFDEHYVSQFVFQPDEVVKNSFEIFVKTPDFVKGIEELESIFEDLKTSIGCCRQVGRVGRVRWRARGSGRSQGCAERTSKRLDLDGGVGEQDGGRFGDQPDLGRSNCVPARGSMSADLARFPNRFDHVTEASERIAEFRERFAVHLANVSGLDLASPLTGAVMDAGVDALADVEEARASRRRCVLCGEPIVLCDPDDPESWVHAEDAGDWGDHSAEIEGDWLGNGGSVVGEGIAGERPA